jgi:hypothetical protein
MAIRPTLSARPIPIGDLVRVLLVSARLFH